MLLVIILILAIFGFGITCLVMAFNEKRSFESIVLHGTAGFVMMFIGTYLSCMAGAL